MRESITLFLAIVLSLLLCLPLGSFSLSWESGLLRASASKTSHLFPPNIFSVHFYSAKKTANRPVCQVELMCQSTSMEAPRTLSMFRVDEAIESIEFFDSEGHLLGTFSSTAKMGQQFLSKAKSWSLTPGIYLACATWKHAESTQKGYAKFVVK